MANQYKQGRRQGQKQERTSLNYQQLTDLYGELVFTPLEGMVKDLTMRGIVLESGDITHVKEVAGDDFAGRVQELRQAIFEAVAQDHKGAYDGWAKQVINDSFGEDEVDNAFFLVLPGQARKHQFITDVVGFVTKHVPGVKVTAETKTNVRAVLGQASDLVQKLSAEVDGAHPESKREAFSSMGEYIRVKAAVRAKRDNAKQELGEMKGKISWLTNWVEGKPRPGKPGVDAPTPTRTAAQNKQAEIEALKARIAAVQADEDRMGGLKNYLKAAEYAAEWAKLANTELPRLEQELAALVQAEVLKQRVGAAAQVLANAPEQATGKFPVAPEGIAAAAVIQVLKDKPAGPSLADEVTKLEADIAGQLAAAEKHEIEAARLSQEGRKVEDDLAAAQMLNNARLERGKAESARGFAAKVQAELDELKAAAEASKPKAETKPAAAATPTTDDPILELEAELENAEEDGLITALSDLLDVAKVAREHGKGTKLITLSVKSAKSGDIGAITVKADALAKLVR